jgi:CRISPR-associated protein Csb1
MNFDNYLSPEKGPVALTICEHLEPVQGKDAVLFPPTFAAPEGTDEKPAYVIDGKIGLVDSVGSQANRIEPMFKAGPYSKLVPQVTVKIGERQINLLDAGHRAADAVIRFSDQAKLLNDAFIKIRDHGNAAPLAKIAPTSLVFGAWDSRDTKVKLPRIIGSVVRAYGVDQLNRSAQFFAVLEKEEAEKLGVDQKFLSNQGLSDNPSGRGPGGVIAREGVVREATLNLIVLRSLGGSGAEETQKLQRYILGLVLVAFFAPAELFLREGCLLVVSEEKKPKIKEVFRDGRREPIEADLDAVLGYARKAAEDFGVGPDLVAEFKAEKVKEQDEKTKNKKAKKTTDGGKTKTTPEP